MHLNMRDTTMKYVFVLLVIGFAISSCESYFNEDISNDQVIVLAPSDGSSVAINPIRFSWEPVEFALDYQLQIANPTFANAQRIEVDTVIRSTIFETALEIGDYEWRVKARNPEYETAYVTQSFENIADRDFTTETAQLLLPQQEFNTNNSSVFFDWVDVPQATEYRWQLVQGTTVLRDENLINSDFNTVLNEGSFTWKVRASNGSENTDFSERQLIVDTTSPETPSPVAPLNNFTTINNTVDFDWDRTDRPGSVEIDSLYLYDDAGLSSLYAKVRGVNKSATVTNIAPDTYYWNVVSYDQAGNQSTASQSSTLIVN